MRPASGAIWKVEDKLARRLMTGCFLSALLVPLTLGGGTVFCVFFYGVIGLSLGLSSSLKIARLAMAGSVLLSIGTVYSLMHLTSSSALILALFLFVSALLLHTEGLRRLAMATNAVKATGRFRSAQLLAIMGVAAYWSPRPESDLATGLSVAVIYGMVLMTGTFLALAHFSWRKEVQAGLADAELDTRL